MALSDVKVKAATVPEGKKQTKLSDGGGLYLLVKSSGKYWKLKYRFAGKEKTLSFGIYPQVSLKEARGRREAAKKQLEQSTDPSQIKQTDKRKAIAATKVATFRGVAAEWLALKSGQWVATTLRHKQADLNNHIFPWVGDMKLSDIEPMDVLSVCQRIESNGHNEAAHRAKMLCSQILRYGVATGRLETDPTRDLQSALAPVVTQHRPCLKDSKEVGGLMRAIKGHKGTFIVHSAMLLAPYVMLRPVELRQLGYDTKEQHCAHGFRGMASTLLHEQGFNTDHIER